MGGWIIVVIAIVVGFDFLLFLGIAATSSAMDAFNREADDREQLQALEEYSRKKAVKRQKRNARKSRFTRSHK